MLYKCCYKVLITGEDFVQDGITYYYAGSGSNSKRFINHYLTDAGKRYAIQYAYSGKYLRVDRKMREYIIKNNKEIYK